MANFYCYYPPGATSTNASIGANGATAPTSSTEVAGINPSGNLQPLQTDAAGALITVPATGSVGHVIVDSSALPTGAATAANQSTSNTTLASIDAKTPTLGNHLMSGSQSVTMASDQTAIPVSLPDGTNQTTTGSFTTTGQYIQVTTGGAGSAVLRTTGTWAGLICLTGSVDGVSFDIIPLYDFTGQSTQLYSGANTPFSANIGGFKYIRAYATLISSGTASVAIWFNPGQSPQICASPNAAGFYVTANTRDGSGNALTSTGAALDVNIKSTGVTQPVSGSVTVTQATGTNLHVVNDAGSAIMGKVGIDQTTPGTTNGVQVVAALPAGSNVIGALTANQSVNNAQVAGVAVSTGNGVSGTGVQRVTLASDSTGGVAISGYTKSNAPVYNSYGTTPVTTSAYVQLVASTTAATKQLQIFDSSGQAMIIATGAAASEVDQIYVPPGGGIFNIAIAASTRISIKALTANTGSSGYIIVEFLG